MAMILEVENSSVSTSKRQQYQNLEFYESFETQNIGPFQFKFEGFLTETILWATLSKWTGLFSSCEGFSNTIPKYFTQVLHIF